ncbi:hypothetical protein [Fluviicola taffensis]|uniref:Uncharacterized protein n=1 Tax=Fluviicola taffensis (strain DSM 16823 / NCIMB 13979 / RW262) TaxID=755732 RepID=F2IBA6_FLUTR|nr:hypothetical protein [Fluviicola taffensis]AEA43192.1 hypothetical protein Fluta_1197 [Fluviicola taffensis DSM 16823]
MKNLVLILFVAGVTPITTYAQDRNEQTEPVKVETKKKPAKISPAKKEEKKKEQPIKKID